MWFRFMHMPEDDQDRLNIYVRIARTIFFTALVTSVTWIVGSTQDILFQGEAFNDTLFDVLSLPCMLFIVMVVFKRGKSPAKSLRRRYVWLPAMTLVVLLGETVTLFGWWDLGPTLGWWRSGLLLLAAATLVMWATERTVQSRRLDRSDVRS